VSIQSTGHLFNRKQSTGGHCLNPTGVKRETCSLTPKLSDVHSREATNAHGWVSNQHQTKTIKRKERSTGASEVQNDGTLMCASRMDVALNTRKALTM
jgi:hypothetical protein